MDINVSIELQRIVDKRIWEIHHKPKMDRTIRLLNALMYQWEYFDGNNLYEPIETVGRFICDKRHNFQHTLYECSFCGLWYSCQMYDKYVWYSRQGVFPEEKQLFDDRKIGSCWPRKARCYWPCCDCRKERGLPMSLSPLCKHYVSDVHNVGDDETKVCGIPGKECVVCCLDKYMTICDSRESDDI